MAAAIVQSVFGSVAAGGSGSITITTSATSTNNTLLVFCYQNGTAGTVTFPSSNWKTQPRYVATLGSISPAGAVGDGGTSYTFSTATTSTGFAVMFFEISGISHYVASWTQSPWNKQYPGNTTSISESAGIAGITNEAAIVVEFMGGTATYTHSYTSGWTEMSAYTGGGMTCQNFYNLNLSGTYTFSDSYTPNPGNTCSCVLSLATLPIYVSPPTVSLSTSDAIASAQVLNRTETDTLSTSDSVSFRRDLLRLLNDALSTSDTNSHQTSLFRTASDTFVMSDTLARTQQLARITTEVFTTMDALDRVQQLGRAPTETLLTVDQVDRTQGLTRVLQNTQITSDAVTRMLAAQRGFTENLITLDDVERVCQYTRQLVESLDTADQLDRLVTVSRQFTETLITNDAVGRVAALQRVISENFTTSDVLTDVLHIGIVIWSYLTIYGHYEVSPMSIASLFSTQTTLNSLFTADTLTLNSTFE
jgi:aspartokinase-like uncharacterized kinase